MTMSRQSRFPYTTTARQPKSPDGLAEYRIDPAAGN
jgi:hypothetical protein